MKSLDTPRVETTQVVGLELDKLVWDRKSLTAMIVEVDDQGNVVDRFRIVFWVDLPAMQNDYWFRLPLAKTNQLSSLTDTILTLVKERFYD